MIDIFIWVILIILALGWGSFATMAVYRLAHNEPWIGRKPYCTSCNHILTFIDYISLLSFFLYRGKCRYCGAGYEYYKVYFVTELSILLYFLLNFFINHFNQIFIINTGIFIPAAIWSIIYYNEKINSEKMLLAMFFFAALLRVYVDQDIFNLIYGVLLASITALFLRHSYYLLTGKFKKSLDYLEYKPEDRFKDEDFMVIKLAAILGAILGVQLKLFIIILLAGVLVLFIKKSQHALALLANLVAISSLLFV